MIKKWTDGTLSTYQIEQRFTLIRIFCAVLISLVVAFLIICVTGTTPLEDIFVFLTAPLSSWSSFCTLLVKFSPLLCTSCAVCLMFSSGEINLSGEGAFFIGAIAATAVGVIPGIPRGIHFLLMALVGALAGAAVCFIPAAMHVRFGVFTVISSLMLNYVVEYLGNWLVTAPMRDPMSGFEASKQLQPTARLMQFLHSPSANPHTGIILGLALVAATFFLLYKTTFGYEVRTVGNNRKFAQFSGINVGRTILLTGMIGGAMCGFGGAVEIAGYYKRLQWTSMPGFGWDGVMIAILARQNPRWIPLAALFLAYVRTSADVLNLTASVPTESVNIVQSIVILLVAAEGFLRGWEKQIIVKNSQAALKRKEG